MLDRDKVIAVLTKRFPHATSRELAAAANALVGLDEEWQEVTPAELPLRHDFTIDCESGCVLADHVSRGVELRLFRRAKVS